jgi:hypothetical protein
MGPVGPLVSWPVPVQLTGLAGAGQMVDTIEIKPLIPALPMPIGGQLDVSFSGMAEAAFTDELALSSVQPIPVLTTSLLPNVPNPFNPATEIRFTLADPVHVKLAIYDLRGRLVRTLLDGAQPAGPGSVRWDGRTEAGAGVAAGVYHALMRTPYGNFTRKLVLVK